jgi:hypothetical protein
LKKISFITFKLTSISKLKYNIISFLTFLREREKARKREREKERKREREKERS